MLTILETVLWPSGSSSEEQDGSLFQSTVKGIASLALAATLFTSSLGAQVAHQDQAEIVPAPVTFQPDEDFWQNPVPPVQASLYVYLPLGDPYELPAGSLFGQPDEDFWRNPVAPVPSSNAWPQQWAFDVQESAGSLFGQYDEDFWRSGVAPIWWTNLYPQQSTFDSQEPVLFGQPDEDYWQNRVLPVQSVLYRSPLLGDQEELPGSLLSGEPDEDFWANPVRPVPPTVYQSLPYLFVESADFVPPVAPQIDEDIWRNPTAPVAASLYQSLPLGDVEQIPAGSLFGQTPEDYWQNPVAPVPATNHVSLPLGDPEELPAGSLFGQFDEDFWNNPVAPVQATVYRNPLFRDPEEVPAGALLKSQAVDEYYWQNWVRPIVAILYQQFPYAFDSGELNAPAQNGTALPAGLSLVAAENNPTGSTPIPGGGGGRRRGRMYPVPASERQPTSAVALARGQALNARAGQVSASGTAQATVSALNLTAQVGKPTAKGIRNPTDEELIAILMGL